MLQHVYERAQRSSYLDDLLVATDDERIAAAVRQFGGRVRMTRSDHPSGTDRLAEIASSEVAALYVNIQGDEPLIDPAAIDAAILALHGDDSIAMGTLQKRIVDPADIVNPNVVKVVTNLLNEAIYFSRCPIPYERDGSSGLPLYAKHVGLYVYRRDFLLRYPDLPVGPLERAECLEQLRAIENGYRIRVVDTEYESLGVDTPEDLERLNHLFYDIYVSGMAKYIFITGGVVSSLGKGIAAASIGCLLESRGLRVTLQKFDPYLNVDPGTMSPFQHGEVFVTDDGAETDLDLGHYERFTHATLTQSNNLTSGRIYENIITRERRGDYLGKTVQVIPHVTNEIKAACRKVATGVDIAIVEIGGTVGDIESLPFMEAIRQMRHEEGRENTLFVHLTLVPWIAAAQELKTKPTQHSVKELRAIGIQPDILLCRSERQLPQDVKEKIALFCDVDVSGVVTAKDVHSVYEVPDGLCGAGRG